MRDIDTLAALATPGDRQATATAIASGFGGKSFIIFVQDPALSIHLPAPGFRQTLPGRAWRTFVAKATRADIDGELPYPDADTPQPVRGLRGADGTVLVLIGRCPPAPELLATLRSLLPLLGSLYRNEMIAAATQQRLLLATEAGLHATVLAQRLDRARSELEQTIRSLRITEDALGAEKEQLAVTLEGIADGVISCDLDGRITLINPSAQALTGWHTEANGRPLTEVFRTLNLNTRTPQEDFVAAVLRSGRAAARAHPEVLIARDGSEHVVTASAAPLRDRAGRTLGAVLVFRDITEHYKNEEERIKAQRLESIGVLAGGIAHDFNNILTALFGNIALAKLRMEFDTETLAILDAAESAFQQARGLTQQLLTFARGGAPIKQTASIAKLWTESANFVLRGADMQCEFRFDPELWPVAFDAGQMNQVVNNLLLNAKEAMPAGGKVVVSGANVRLGNKEVGELPAGRYVVIAVTDEGAGMEAHLLPKIFDPYFSTKARGTGLGLTTTYSIVRRHGGHIAVTSQPGRGTTFKVFLPAALATTDEPHAPAPPLRDGTGRVLLMDDEQGVRTVGHALLTALGYDVTCAADGAEAIQHYRDALATGEVFACVIMDLTVPQGMGGAECLTQLKTIDANVCAIVSSGYATHPVMAEYAAHGFSGVLLKPYQLSELRETLAHALTRRDKRLKTPRAAGH